MLLSHCSFWKILLINIIVCALWGIIAFILCIKLNPRIFDCNRGWFQIKKWENNGKIYSKYFKIKKWKDVLPQYVGKNGFSKRNINLKNLDINYIDTFLLETCRAEWVHTAVCLYAVIAFIINPPIYAVIFSLLVIIVNLAYVCIQRYNRARLLSFKNRLVRIEEKRLAKQKI